MTWFCAVTQWCCCSSSSHATTTNELQLKFNSELNYISLSRSYSIVLRMSFLPHSFEYYVELILLAFTTLLLLLANSDEPLLWPSNCGQVGHIVVAAVFTRSSSKLILFHGTNPMARDCLYSSIHWLHLWWPASSRFLQCKVERKRKRDLWLRCPVIGDDEDEEWWWRVNG